jgi:hypothetical protein
VGCDANVWDENSAAGASLAFEQPDDGVWPTIISVSSSIWYRERATRLLEHSLEVFMNAKPIRDTGDGSSGDDDPRLAFVYQEAVRGLVHQQNIVESLNNRAGNLI